MGLRGRLLLAFLLPTVAVLCLGGFGLYRANRDVLEQELGRSLADLAGAVSSELKGERVLAIEADDDLGEGSRTYRSLMAQLAETRARTGLRRIVVVDVERRVRLDTEKTVRPMSEATELLRDSLELRRVLAGERAASQVLFEGLDGQLYKTGYAPLLQDGAVVGVVAVEGTAAFFGPLTRLLHAFVVLAGLTLALLTGAALLSARGVARPLERLMGAALRIGRGDLATPVAPEPTREIGVLARELEAMRTSLESRDRQLKLMLGGVAHEVKNPLGGIELFAGLLDEELASSTPNTAEARDHVARIRRELGSLKRLVEDFLSFARDQKLTVAPFSALAVAQAAVTSLWGEAQGKQVSVVTEVSEATLHGDASLLTSTVVNLVKNAVQVSVGGQRVIVRGAPSGTQYCFEVEDAGPGIAADLQAKIFEPFFTTKEQGSGLGLSLARKLAEAHRGTLSVDSRPGRTVFRLALPLSSSTELA